MLIRAAMTHDRPILGVCRGLQILNVALGGSLYQDIATQHPARRVHRDHEEYDRLQHELCFEPGSWIGRRYQGRSGGRVNSVHHQAINRLAPNLCVEAQSTPDGIVEAIRYDPQDPGAAMPFVYGVQWHPEYQDPSDTSLLPTAPLREMFLEAVIERRAKRDA
jgi:putative glutamine amidotransferase